MHINDAGRFGSLSFVTFFFFFVELYTFTTDSDHVILANSLKIMMPLNMCKCT